MNMFKTVVLLTLLTLLFITIGGMIGGKSGMVMAFVIALAMNFISYFFSDKIVLMMYRAKEVKEQDAPKLYAIVQKLAMKAKLPMPKVYTIPQGAPNAFATGRSPQHAAVAATDGLIGALSDEEIEGVLAHELAHVRHRDILISSIVATVAGAIYMLANWARWAAFAGGGRNKEGGAFRLVAIIALTILAPIAATLIQLAISRAREFDADEGGARISGKPMALASALRKLESIAKGHPMQASPTTAHMFIVNPLSGSAVLNLFSTHPPMAKRIEKLEKLAGGVLA